MTDYVLTAGGDLVARYSDLARALNHFTDLDASGILATLESVSEDD